MGGYIGSAQSNGVTTTLGRGGSRLQRVARRRRAAGGRDRDLDGRRRDAHRRSARGARRSQLIERIAFDEASELASFGAKVLHPNTIAPAVTKGIPVWILNSRRPEGTGTLITFDAPRRPVTAIAGKSGVSLVKVRSAAHAAHRRVHAPAVRRVRAAQDVGRRRRDVRGQRLGHDRRCLAPRGAHGRPARARRRDRRAQSRHRVRRRDGAEPTAARRWPARSRRSATSGCTCSR